MSRLPAFIITIPSHLAVYNLLHLNIYLFSVFNEAVNNTDDSCLASNDWIMENNKLEWISKESVVAEILPGGLNIFN
jgi:hypothetical protein